MIVSLQHRRMLKIGTHRAAESPQCQSTNDKVQFRFTSCLKHDKDTFSGISLSPKRRLFLTLV